MPGFFSITRSLGARHSLRCILFHDIAVSQSSFTKGLGATVTPSDFEAALKYLTRHYTPVRLSDVLADADGRGLPPKPVLVTFDDAYASVREIAAPLCRRYGVPAVFFINAACLDNQRLLIDNLVCHVANVSGMDSINAAVRSIKCHEGLELRSLGEVFARFLPYITLADREAFRDALVTSASIDERELAGDARLYLSSQRVRDLKALDFEIGNHTYTHVHCRSLTALDFSREVDRNRAVLETLSGADVRSFSVPYGSSADLTGELLTHLRLSGHQAVFLSESVANRCGADVSHLDRVSPSAVGGGGLFRELEVLPRLRAIRNRYLRVGDQGPQQS